MLKGDTVYVLHEGSWVSLVIDGVEPRQTWDGKSLDGWIDAVVLRFPSGKRVRVKRGIIEESDRFCVQSQLVAA